MRPRRLLTIALLTVLATATVSPSAGAAQGTRYLDEVFAKIRTTKGLVYGRAVNSRGKLETLRLDVHEPAGDTAPVRAAVVWVHGGFFIEGSSESYPEAWTQFARAGFVTFSINYRLHPDLPRGAGAIVSELEIQQALDATRNTQHDAQAAVRWVRAHAAGYRIDPDRIAIAGHSAGGITSQLVAYNDHDAGTSGTPGESSTVAAAVSMAGGSVPLLMTRVDTGEPPLLLIHGVMDDIVPFVAGPPSCVAALILLNTCEFVIHPTQDHGTFGYEFAREFLYRQMIAKPSLRLPTNVTVTGVGDE